MPIAARQAIERANTDWLKAMKIEDAEAIAEPYDDVGVFVSASGEVATGRPAIARLMKERFAREGHLVGGELQQDGVLQVGSMVHEWGYADLRLQLAAAQPTRARGRYLTVWRTDASGRWTILRNLSLPY